jgi:glyoxylase-like metal-dependent hydrolase (beta-lactamase superfamily II)
VLHYFVIRIKNIKLCLIIFFMVERIAEDVYKISAEGNVYVYLKPEVVVIDCSEGRYKELIKKEIESLVPLDQVKKIFLTHLHFDHVGNLDLFPDAEVYASKKELDDFKESPDVFSLIGVDSGVLDRLRETKELDGDVGWLKVLEVPGHTRGCVAFLDEERKLLFSGDTLFFNGAGRIDFDNSLPDEMEGSVRKLVNLVKNEGYKLCPGHDY